MSKFKSKLKSNWIFILLIILAAFIQYNKIDLFNTDSLLLLDHTTYYLPRYELLQQSIQEYGDFWPLWEPYGMSGKPLLIGANFLGIDSYAGLLLTIIPNPIYAVKMSYFLAVIIAGLTMYLLMTYLVKNRWAALLSALVYILNGFVGRHMGDGSLSQLCAYSISPLIILFAVKTFREKKWVFNAFMTAILFALQIRLGPDLKVTLFLAIMFSIYLVFQLFSRNFNKRFDKVVVVAILVLIIVAGLSAQRLLPAKEVLSLSPRASLSYEESASRVVPLSKTFANVVEPFSEYEDGHKIGIIAFFLCVFAVFKKPRNKFVLFLVATILFALSITTGSVVFKFLWTYIPPFDSFRYLERVFALSNFAASILAGVGAYYFANWIKRKFKLKNTNIIYSVLILLIVLNLMVFAPRPIPYKHIQDIKQLVDENQILQDISERDGVFRIHTFETAGIDWGTDFYNVPLKLEHIFSYDPLWISDYFSYLVDYRNNPNGKHLGNLNVKYITSMGVLSLPGFELIKKFDKYDCPVEGICKAHGPYLYENTMYLPRAYFIDHASVVVGDNETRRLMAEEIIKLPEFSFSKTVLIEGKDRIASYNAEELKKFNMVILAQEKLSDKEASILRSFWESGGQIFPDIFNNEFDIDLLGLNPYFAGLDEAVSPIEDSDYSRKSFSKINLKLPDRKGWLVISERFSLFPGWHAVDNNKVDQDIYKANAVISAIFLDTDVESLDFFYKPKSYVIGFFISVFTLILVLLYFVYYFKNEYKKHKNK